MNKENLLIRADRIYTQSGLLKPGLMFVEEGKIQSISKSTDDILGLSGKKYQTLIFEGYSIIPGFIDTHIHGRLGYEFGEDIDSTKRIIKDLPKSGVTSVLPTLGAKPSLEEIIDSIKTVTQVMNEADGGAGILGIHMEGPYFSNEKYARGSQPTQYFRNPSVDELHKFIEASNGSIRKLALAPELDGSIDVTREASKSGIVVCAGHSNATYEETLSAIEAGLSCSTHTFNGMPPFHHRNPGLVGAILTHDEINAEFIPDGQHISPVAIKLLIRCKSLNRMHAVSDNTRYAGLADGEYADKKKGRTVVKEGNKAYVKGGTLAGSVCQLDHGIKILTNQVGLGIEDSIKLLSENPAKVIGIYEGKGSIEIGKDADFLVIDDELNILKTFVRGKDEYSLQ